MSFTDAIKTNFRKYFAFCGRAPRSEYWWFVLFAVLVSTGANLIDSAIYGDELIRTDVIDELTYATYRMTGPFATVFGYLILIPLLSAGWRRMHDTGRSGLLLLLPVIVIVACGTLAAFQGVNELSFGLVLILTTGVLALVLSLSLLTWWLTRPTQAGPNKYGPNPHEVTP